MRRCILFLLMLSAPLCALTPSFEPFEKVPRSFEVGISEAQVDDLHYLLTSLAFNSYEDILADRISLQSAMQRIDKAHPLHNLMVMFTDTWLIKSIHAIHEKEWLWRQFIIRLKRSLQEEWELDNIQPQYVDEFCGCLDLDFETTLSMVENEDWDALVDTLLVHFPNDED